MHGSAARGSVTPIPETGCRSPRLCGEHAPGPGAGRSLCADAIDLHSHLLGRGTLFPSRVPGNWEEEGLPALANGTAFWRGHLSPTLVTLPSPHETEAVTAGPGPSSQHCLRSVTAIPVGQGQGQMVGRTGRVCSPFPICMEDMNTTQPGALEG